MESLVTVSAQIQMTVAPNGVGVMTLQPIAIRHRPFLNHPPSQLQLQWRLPLQLQSQRLLVVAVVTGPPGSFPPRHGAVPPNWMLVVIVAPLVLTLVIVLRVNGVGASNKTFVVANQIQTLRVPLNPRRICDVE